MRPVRITEPQMFRVVVIVGIAMVPVILLAAIVDPLAGAILFGVEFCVAGGYLINRLRAARARRRSSPPIGPSEKPEPGTQSPPDEPEPPLSPPADSRR